MCFTLKPWKSEHYQIPNISEIRLSTYFNGI